MLEGSSRPPAGRPTSPSHDGLAGGLTPEQILDVMTPLAFTAYHWDHTTDRMRWANNAHAVLGVDASRSFSSGSEFYSYIQPEHHARHDVTAHAAVSSDAQQDISYRITYRLNVPQRSDVQTSPWVEEDGRVWFDQQGRALRRSAIVRRLQLAVGNAPETATTDPADCDEIVGREQFLHALVSLLSAVGPVQRPAAVLMFKLEGAGLKDASQISIGGNDVASIVRSELRAGDVIARYAHDTIAVLLTQCPPATLRNIAERLRNCLGKLLAGAPETDRNTDILIGSSSVEAQDKTPAAIADRALMSLTSCAVDDVEESPASPAIYRSTCDKTRVGDDIVSALNDHRMQLALQPLICAQSGRTSLYECLLRMELPDGRVATAAEFVTIAEELGLWRMLDDRTLDLAIELARQHDGLDLSLNVSSLTTNDRLWLDRLRKLTNGDRGLSERLIVEITETQAIQDLQRTQAFVGELKTLGCRVALDDFGAGYTSFRNLQQLDLDMVKIDASFVRRMAESSSDRVFIKTLLELAENFGLDSVAEGVGDERSARQLANMGVTYLQGFHYGEPRPAHKLPDMASAADCFNASA